MVRITVFFISFWILFSTYPAAAANLPPVLKDSKPLSISLADRVLLKPVILRIGASRMNLLVNRFTDKVEYVWSNAYKRYVRPKYTAINAQILYDQFHN